MQVRSMLAMALVFGFAIFSTAEDNPPSKPVELEVLKASIGVWDAQIEVWPQGPDSPSIAFKGTETIRGYGEHWIASDFDSEFNGQIMKVHSIVGYDLEKKKLVGTVIDHGPYSASMTGDYDEPSKTVSWMTKARDANGRAMVQETLVTQENAHKRVLVLMVPGEKEGAFTKFMQIKFVMRNGENNHASTGLETPDDK